MFFLQPIWLAAMAGMILPVIVHFWNDRRGKVLRIGSIHLLEEASPRMSWSRLPSQWWLLLLRCLLVMALALLLAGPYWEHRGPKGWVLADGGAAGVYGSRIDSLVKAGWERRVLGDTVNYWNAFRIADQMAPQGAEFRVFSLGLASRFKGLRPSSERVVHWEVYAPVDSVKEWEEKAWLVSGDSGRVMRGLARLTGSQFTYQTVASGGAVDTNEIRIAIHTDAGYQQDRSYLAAALRAVQEFTHRRMKIVPEGAGDWLFWLSSQPVPAGAADRYATIWQYGVGKEKKVDTRMEGTGLYREIAGGADSGAVVWKDGFGRGVLTREGKAFRFYSRLDPDWGELVWSREFPVLLARMIYGEEGPGDKDLRMMDVAQVGPVRGVGDGGPVVAAGAADRRAGAIDLGAASWVLIFLLFILERWWSGKE